MWRLFKKFMGTRSEQTFDLTTATDDLAFTVRGDWYFVDTGSTGIATVKNGTPSELPVTLTGGASYDHMVDTIFLTWPVQPGRFLRVFYGNGKNPFTGGNAAPIYTANAVGQLEYIHNSGVLASDVIVAAADNLRGIVIRQARADIVNALAGNLLHLWAGPTPADVRFILNLDNVTAGQSTYDRVQNWVVPPGQMLECDAVGVGAYLNVRYDIL